MKDDFSPTPQETALSHLSCLIGFILSALLSLGAYFLVFEKLIEGDAAFAAIWLMAVLQIFTQVAVYFHLGKEARPRWNTIVFLFMAMVAAIIVSGSLWILYNLMTRMMYMHD